MTGTNFVIIIPDIQMNMIGLEKDKLVEESYLQLSSKTLDVWLALQWILTFQNSSLPTKTALKSNKVTRASEASSDLFCEVRSAEK